MRVRLAEALAEVGDHEAAAREVEAARGVFAELGAGHDLRGLDGLLDRVEPPGGLSAREVEVLRCVCAGHTNRQIPTALTISEKTVARHLSTIFVKLDVGSRTQAAGVAFKHGLAVGRLTAAEQASLFEALARSAWLAGHLADALGAASRVIDLAGQLGDAVTMAAA